MNTYDGIVERVIRMEASLSGLPQGKIDSELMQSFDLTRSELRDIRGIKDVLDFVEITFDPNNTSEKVEALTELYLREKETQRRFDRR